MSATLVCSTVDPRTIGGLMKSWPAIAAFPPCVSSVSGLIVELGFAIVDPILPPGGWILAWQAPFAIQPLPYNGHEAQATHPSDLRHRRVDSNRHAACS